MLQVKSTVDCGSVSQESDLFMTHNLYGSSLLMVFDEVTGEVRVRMIDIRTLVPRGARLKNHRVASWELPLPVDSPTDGYLTGLDNLATFLTEVCEDAWRARMTMHVCDGGVCAGGFLALCGGCEEPSRWTKEECQHRDANGRSGGCP